MALLLDLQLNMYDSAHALEHLRGKYMVLFGDSTMQENVYDLIVLLSGISKDRVAMDTFMNTSIWLPWCASPEPCHILRSNVSFESHYRSQLLQLFAKVPTVTSSPWLPTCIHVAH